MKNFLFSIIALILVSLLWWFQYLINIFPDKYTIKNIQKESFTSINKDVSAIVVLTGAKGRFEKGFELLEKKISNKMFISGVYPGVNLEKKYEHLIKNINFFKCCIFFGNNAYNTNQNADEVKNWIKNNEIRHIFLITSYYHLPRAKIIFEEKMPIDLDIFLVSSDKFSFRLENIIYLAYNFRLIILEYFKILYTFIFLKI